MTAVLIFTKGPRTGQRLEPEGELVIGREGAAVTIEDSELSRRHAAVRPVEGGIEIEDLGSLNGTFVNGRRIDCADPPGRRRFGQDRPERPGARRGGRARHGHVSRSNPGRRAASCHTGRVGRAVGTVRHVRGARGHGPPPRHREPPAFADAALVGGCGRDRRRAGDLLREPLSPENYRSARYRMTASATSTKIPIGAPRALPLVCVSSSGRSPLDDKPLSSAFAGT